MFAYYFLLSLFPLLVSVATLLPYFNINPETIKPYIEILLPLPVFDVIMPMVDSLLTTVRGGLLSLGIFTTLWSASKIIKHMQAGIDAAYGVKEKSTYIISRIISVITLILAILLLLALTVVFSFGETLLLRFATISGWAVSLLHNLNTIKWPLPICMLLLTVVLIYISTPNLKLRIRDVLPGSILSMGFMIGSVQIFALYINYAVQPLSAYGTLSSFFILMLWTRFMGYILLIGAVLNATLYELLHGEPPLKKSRVDDYIRQQFDKLIQTLKAKKG